MPRGYPDPGERPSSLRKANVRTVKRRGMRGKGGAADCCTRRNGQSQSCDLLDRAAADYLAFITGKENEHGEQQDPARNVQRELLGRRPEGGPGLVLRAAGH